MIGRLMKMTAKPGQGAALADVLLRVAEGLRGYPGCEVYLIAQDSKDPDTVRVIEVWQSEDAAQAALSSMPADDAPKPADVYALLAGAPERADLDLLGGVGVS